MVALALALFSLWWSGRWAPAVIPAVLFLLSALLLVALASRPPIVILEDRLMIGRRSIPWADIRRVDRTDWSSPLVVSLTLSNGQRVVLIYPGDLDSANSLLRHVRRSARNALIDGVPYPHFWGEPALRQSGPEKPQPPRYPLLRPEDEAEVEMLYQRLKVVGRLDPKNSSDET